MSVANVNRHTHVHLIWYDSMFGSRSCAGEANSLKCLSCLSVWSMWIASLGKCWVKILELSAMCMYLWERESARWERENEFYLTVSHVCLFTAMLLVSLVRCASGLVWHLTFKSLNNIVFAFSPRSALHRPCAGICLRSVKIRTQRDIESHLTCLSYRHTTQFGWLNGSFVSMVYAWIWFLQYGTDCGIFKTLGNRYSSHS